MNISSILRVGVAWILLGGAQSLAQPMQAPGQQPRATMTSYAATQQQLDSYNPRASAEERERQLTRIMAGRLQPTSANFDTVARLLASTAALRDKELLVSILGNLYTPDDRSGRNAQIRAQVKSLISHGERSLASAALITYSRMAYFPDTPELLQHAISDKVIDEETYVRELSITLPAQAPDVQRIIITRLADLRVPLGVASLVFSLDSPNSIARLAPENRQPVLALLYEREPTFPFELGGYGLVDASRYARWLHVVGSISESISPGGYVKAVSAKLNDPKTDPRKLLAYYTHPRSAGYVRQMRGNADFQASVTRALAFADQFPGHPTLQDVAQEVRQTMGRKAP